MRYLFILFFTVFIFFCNGNQQWSWLYSIKPDAKVSSLVIEKDDLIWIKTDVPSFSQLLFSWNAFRAEKGYFSFWVQVRDEKTKQWYDWHKMACWGKDNGRNIQYSLASKSRGGTSFHFVRLELPKGCLADAFKIKVDLHKSAKLKNLFQISVNTVDRRKFTSEVNLPDIDNLRSIYINSVPKISQMVLKHPAADSICSPTSITILINYLLKEKFDPCLIANGVFDNGLKIYGSWPFNVAHAFEVCKGRISFHVERLNSFKNLHTHLIRGIPVIVSVRGPLPGSATPYGNGHLLVVVGYDKEKKQVICHDPAFNKDSKTCVRYKVNDFIRAWERSERLAYIAIRI